MALAGFSVHSPSTVILDDGRDPDVSWANHERRYPGQSNRGGVDVVAPVGTPVHAWADGTVRNLANQGSAGNVAHLDLAHDPGWSMEAKHLSRFAVPNGQWVAAGTVIGYSGTSGGVAPHVHYNLLDPRGIRRNPWHYIDAGQAAAGEIEEDDMYSDNDRARDEKTASQVNSIWRAIYEIPVDDFAQRQTGLGRALKDIRDALFKKTTVPGSTTGSRDIPGGTLATLAAIADKLNIK